MSRTYRKGVGHGGLRHPRHIGEFNKMTEVSMGVTEDENQCLVFENKSHNKLKKLVRDSRSDRRHGLKKMENRKFRNGIKEQTKRLIDEDVDE